LIEKYSNGEGDKEAEKNIVYFPVELWWVKVCIDVTKTGWHNSWIWKSILLSIMNPTIHLTMSQ
jgi:hypothetical protein